MKNKVILITGVSSGMGKAFVFYALKHLNEGDVIIGLGRNNIEDVEDKQYIFIKVDLRNKLSIQKAMDQIRRKFGKVDILINNAGLGYRGTIEDLSLDEIKDQFEVNFFGLISLTQLVLPTMRKQKSGHIINVSSVGSVVSTPTLGYYAATKAALDKISEVLAQEVEKYNIKVSIFIPGAVKTDFGKNIRLAKQSSMGVYSELYKEWESRFSFFFRNRNTPEEAASKLWELVQTQRWSTFVSSKDKIMCFFKRIFPDRLFYFLFLNYYYKYES